MHAFIVEMSDLRFKPKVSFVTRVHSDGHQIALWAQSDVTEVIKLERIREINYFQMFSNSFQSADRQPITPEVNKYYVFCEKSNFDFYRVLVKAFDPEDNEVTVLFIDFGYEERVAVHSLFVFDQMFTDCRPLAQKYLLSGVRPKDPTKGFDSRRVVQSLAKFLRTIQLLAICSDNGIKIVNENGVDLIKTSLLSDGIDDVLIEETNDLIAIEFSESETTIKDLIDLKESCVESERDNTGEERMRSHLETLFGSKRWVYVTKTFSSNSIYVQIKDNFEDIEEMNRKLTLSHSEDNESEPVDLVVDLVIAAQFSQDQSWYRASVVEVKKKKIKVFYIDFGNSETIERSQCRHLKAEFRALPPQAIHCRPLNEGLGAHTLEIFETNTEELECQFLALNNHTMDVKLFDKGVLLSGDSVASTPQETKVMVEEEVVEEVVDKLTLKKEEERVSLTREVIERTDDFLLSLVGTKSRAIVSKAISAQFIYVQLEDNLSRVIEPLVTDMKSFYSEEKSELRRLDALVAVYCDLEERWMRGRVVREIDQNLIQVFYVDFGSEEKVERSRCRPLDEIHFGDVFQAIACRPKNKTYYELKNRESQEKPFELRFVSREEKCLEIDF